MRRACGAIGVLICIAASCGDGPSREVAETPAEPVQSAATQEALPQNQRIEVLRVPRTEPLHLVPRLAEEPPAPLPSLAAMIEAGRIVLVSSELAQNLQSAFDPRTFDKPGFCVILHLERDQPTWIGFAGDNCHPLSITGADDAPYRMVRKDHRSWELSVEGDPSVIRLSEKRGVVVAEVYEDSRWAKPVVVVPGESPRERRLRWHRDAERAFLERAAAEAPELRELDERVWELRGKRVRERTCEILAHECDGSRLLLACDYDDPHPKKQLLIHAEPNWLLFEETSEELPLEKCGGRGAVFPGLVKPESD